LPNSCDILRVCAYMAVGDTQTYKALEIVVRRRFRRTPATLAISEQKSSQFAQ
jgi:hypothetical protein